MIMPNKLKESPCFSVSSISSSDSAYSSGDSLSEFRRVSRSTDTLSPDLSAYFHCPIRSYGEFSHPQKIPEPEVPEWIRKECRKKSTVFVNESTARRRANSAGEKLLHFFHLGSEARRASVNAEKKKAYVNEWMQLDAGELIGKRADKSGFRKRAATTGSAGKDVLNALLRFRSPSRDRKRESIPEATVGELTDTSKAPVAPGFKSGPLVLKYPEEPVARPRSPSIWDQQLQNACAANVAAAKMEDFWICHTPRLPDLNNQRDDSGLRETTPTAVGDHNQEHIDVYKQEDAKLHKPMHKIYDGIFAPGGEFFMPLIDNGPQKNGGNAGKSTGNVFQEEALLTQQKREAVTEEQKEKESDLLAFTDNPRPLIQCLRIAASTVYARLQRFTDLYDIPADHRLRKLVQLVRLVLFGAYRQVDGQEKHAH